MLKNEDLSAYHQGLAYQQALAKSMKPVAGAQEDALHTHMTYTTGGTVLNQAAVEAAMQALQSNNGRRQGTSWAQQYLSIWANQVQLPSKRAKGVHDAPHIGITVNGEMLHMTAYNTQLGLHGLLPKMKVKTAPKWLTDKVAVLRIMEPHHDWVTAIGQRTGEHYFLVLCPYKYAPRKERTKW